MQSRTPASLSLYQVVGHPLHLKLYAIQSTILSN